MEINGIQYIRANSISKATHWRPTAQLDTIFNVSINRIYKLFEMPDYPFNDDEYWIVNDEGKTCMAYMVVPGYYLKLENEVMPRLTERQFLDMTSEERSRRFYIDIENVRQNIKISKEELDLLNEFDVAAEKAGGYIDKTAESPPYNIQNMYKWCIANNRDIETLTTAEREMFRSDVIARLQKYATPNNPVNAYDHREQMEKDRAKELGPRVRNVIPSKEDFTLILHFDNGEVKIFDVKPYMEQGIFKQLKDPKVFAAVRPFNGSICWKSGQDFCTHTLYLRSESLSHALDKIAAEADQEYNKKEYISLAELKREEFMELLYKKLKKAEEESRAGETLPFDEVMDEIMAEINAIAESEDKKSENGDKA